MTVDFKIDARAQGDKLPRMLDRLRETAPIFWSEQNHAWLVTGYQQVVDGFSGNLPLSATRIPFMAVANVPEQDRHRLLPNVMTVPMGLLLNMDGEPHQRLRRMMVKAFGRGVVETIRPHVQRFIRETLDAAAKIDGPFDFVASVSRVIPGRMILNVLGLDDALLPKLHNWSLLMNQFGNVGVALETLRQLDNMLAEMRALFEPQFEKRRKHPTDDFLSALVTASEDQQRLSNEELLATCVVVLIAGHDTTANTIALGTAELARHPELIPQFLADPGNILNAIMELQRHIGMSNLMGRIVAKDFEWEGKQLKKGDFVLLVEGAANRDPTVFPQPERFDATRDQSMNMAFAPGAHHCIGHLLAKMVLSEFFPAFLRRFDVEVLDEELLFAPNASFRGLDKLIVRLHEKTSGA